MIALLERFKEALSKTATLFNPTAVDATLTKEERLDALEESLLRADVGLKTTLALRDWAEALEDNTLNDAASFKEALKTKLLSELEKVEQPDKNPAETAMQVVLVVGVNGAGKTTLIGKLAHQATASGLKVLIGAADTFRAAADEQLAVWADRAGAGFVSIENTQDPSAVVYQTMQKARQNNADLVIIDTAGRLQNKHHLMEELSKLNRILDRERPEGSQVERLLVVDGTSGQNAIQQAKLFGDCLPLTGAAVTKLDGSPKGGMIIALAAECKLPVRYVGLGEHIDALQVFDKGAYTEALLG